MARWTTRTFGCDKRPPGRGLSRSCRPVPTLAARGLPYGTIFGTGDDRTSPISAPATGRWDCRHWRGSALCPPDPILKTLVLHFG